MKRNPVHYMIIGISILLLLVTLLVDGKDVARPKPMLEKGILDLSGYDFEVYGNVDLSGNWLFYPNQLLSPEALKVAGDREATSLPIPLTAEKLKKLNLNRELYGTLKLTVILPKDARLLGLRSDLMLSANRLFVEGKLAQSVGTPGTSKEATTPQVRVTEHYFNAENQVVELVYQVSDFYMGDSTIIAPILGTAKAISTEAKMALARDLFLFGMLFIIGIYHLGLFGMRTKDRSALYFALFCICFALRMGLVGERFALEIIQVHLSIILKACYLFLCVGIVSMFGFLYVTFPEVFKRGFMRVVLASSLLMALCVLGLEYLTYQFLFNLYLCVVFPLILYAVFRLFQAVKQKIEYASLVLVGIVCISAAAVNDLIFQLTLSNRGSMIPVGMFIFIMTQAFTLSSKFSKTFAMAEDLSLENEKMLFEIREVNRSLEERVEERTQDLQRAMVNLENMSRTDYLTGLPNRRFVFEQLEESIEQQRSFFIVLADLDHFKKINDTHGHDVGDQVLKAVSQVLLEELGHLGFVGRWGGEEFIMAIFESDYAQALHKVNQMREAVKGISLEAILPVALGSKSENGISITLGMCQFARPLSLDQCIKFADEALYKGKESGRNCTVTYELVQ